VFWLNTCVDGIELASRVSRPLSLYRACPSQNWGYSDAVQLDLSS